ncbi:TrmH family RNA methyltransferase [bacterium]|nr:MAG: TrmH family RNA methyltransferase [bacterium]
MRKLTHAEIKEKRKDLSEIDNYKRNPIYGLCDNIRSIFNVGAIFRASDGAFIEKLFLTGYTPHPPRKEIEKVALGATLSVPWEYSKNPLDSIYKLKNDHVNICVVELTDKSESLWSNEERRFPVCLVVGNEITGVSKDIIDTADSALEIPMYGMKQSLNVSVAYGIAVYEILRIIKTTSSC